VGADDGEVGHANHLVLALAFNDGELGDHVVIVTENLANLIRFEQSDKKNKANALNIGTQTSLIQRRLISLMISMIRGSRLCISATGHFSKASGSTV
jgi:hypothetical protein